MQKVRCKKEFGVWFYTKEMPNDWNELDGTIYTLYNEKQELVAEFGVYWHMKHYIETGEVVA